MSCHTLWSCSMSWQIIIVGPKQIWILTKCVLSNIASSDLVVSIRLLTLWTHYLIVLIIGLYIGVQQCVILLNSTWSPSRILSLLHSSFGCVRLIGFWKLVSIHFISIAQRRNSLVGFNLNQFWFLAIFLLDNFNCLGFFVDWIQTGWWIEFSGSMGITTFPFHYLKI